MKIVKWKYYLLPILTMVLCFTVFTTVFAQNNQSFSKENIQFIDSLIEKKIKEYKVPGLSICLIIDSSKVFYKGYGLSDIKHNKAVDGIRTGFKIASITKTFTALAIMKLYEAGKIDLHKDINNYLPNNDFPFINNQHITIHQLLTHTAGFDITDINDASKSPESIESLSATIQKYMPARVHPPGLIYSYSNFGYALLGFIIEHVSGMEYDAYMKKEIFDPLNMEHSSVAQVLPEKLESQLSHSYTGNENKILNRDYTKVAPADGIITTGRDMSNYMLALLNGCSFEDREMINGTTFSLLTSQQYGSLNTRRGICYSFLEGSRQGMRSLEHTGGATGFVSLLILIPESGAGVFISQNKRQGTQSLRYDLAEHILEALVLNKKKTITKLPDPLPNFNNIATKYEGHYRQINYSHSTFQKITQLFGLNAKEFEVQNLDNNLLSINGLLFIPISDTHFIFDNPEYNWEIEFKKNANDEVVKIFNNTTTYEKIKNYERNKVKQWLGALALIVVLLNFIISTARRILQIKKKDKISHFDFGYLISALTSISVLFFGIIFSFYGDQLTDYGIPFVLKIALIFSSLVAIFAIYTPIYLIKYLRSNKSTLSKLWMGLVLLSTIILLLYFWQYNLVGLNY